MFTSHAQNKTIKHQFVQSFRNLDMALQQAKQNSLADMKTKEMCDSLTNLDEATALAIQNSLDKSMYESFRNLGGAIEQARNQSLSDSNKSDDDSNMFESFRNLEDAMAMAMAASLEEEKGKQQSSNFGADNCILEGDENSESEDSVELQQVVKTNSTRKMGRNNSSGGDNNNSSSAGIVHVAEAAPDLERLARRHANRRFEQERVRANDGGEGVAQSMNCGRTRKSGRRISGTDLSGQTEEVEEEGASSSRRRVECRRSSADSLQGRSRRRSASERIELGMTQDLSREDSAAAASSSSRRGSDESSSSTRRNGERSSSKRTSFVGMVGNELKSGAGLINDLIEPTLEKVLGPPISSSSRGDNNNSSRRSSMSSGTTDDIDDDKVEDMHFAHGRRTSALLEDNPLDNKKEKRKKGGSKKKLFGSIKKKSSSKK